MKDYKYTVKSYVDPNYYADFSIRAFSHENQLDDSMGSAMFWTLSLMKSGEPLFIAAKKQAKRYDVDVRLLLFYLGIIIGLTAEQEGQNAKP